MAALSEYTMRDVYVRPWRELVARAGLRAAMRSHEAWDALPLHANNYMAEVGCVDGLVWSICLTFLLWYRC